MCVQFTAIEFSPRADLLVVAGTSQWIRVYAVDGGACVHRLQFGERTLGTVRSLTMLPSKSGDSRDSAHTLIFADGRPTIGVIRLPAVSSASPADAKACEPAASASAAKSTNATLAVMERSPTFGGNATGVLDVALDARAERGAPVAVIALVEAPNASDAQCIASWSLPSSASSALPPLVHRVPFADHDDRFLRVRAPGSLLVSRNNAYMMLVDVGERWATLSEFGAASGRFPVACFAANYRFMVAVERISGRVTVLDYACE